MAKKKEHGMTETRTATLFKELEIPVRELVIGIKGGGEMATGIACRLFNAHIRHIFMMEIEAPMAVRRRVSFCEAVHDGLVRVEGIEAKRISHPGMIPDVWKENRIPVLVDPSWETIRILKPHAVVDALIAKRNLGTVLTEAPLVIGLGPGFTAGEDVHMAVETNRGHDMGRVILKGSPEPNTGIPGTIAGFAGERVLRAPCPGVFTSHLDIGAPVKKGDVVGHVDTEPVITIIDGVIRGLIRPGTRVRTGLKIGDVDPRSDTAYCTTISEKARAIGGSVLEAVLRHYNS
ncbi:MAG: selenium-dependent molybdenum cofactor biosynthesis protein YqeB [Desulfobacula sp.]|nr:selenium-dependent molybdenum cofactor biosynthesis protein YqeB [Desulfobacula sp.]